MTPVKPTPPPAHLTRPAEAPRLAEQPAAAPRIILVTPMSSMADRAPAGSIVLDNGEPLRSEVALVGLSHYWAMYPEYQEGGVNRPLWIAMYGSDAAERPECRWNGDEKPAAAEVFRLVFWGPEIDLRVMTCQRSACRPAKAMLTELDALGCVIFGPRWTISSQRTGKVLLPTFTQTGWTSEAEAAEIGQLAAAIKDLESPPDFTDTAPVNSNIPY